jgi:hypothetical protein
VTGASRNLDRIFDLVADVTAAAVVRLSPS